MPGLTTGLFQLVPLIFSVLFDGGRERGQIEGKDDCECKDQQILP